MSELILITGGQRSGKSSFGQNLAEKKSRYPVFLATARSWDDDFKARIARHQEDRGSNWKTIEEEKDLGKLDLTGETVLLDCITLWLTNIFHDNAYDPELTLQEAKKEWGKLVAKDCTLIVISNEIGMGVHAETESSRKFADIQGWMNQQIASEADEVYLMVSGIPVKIKP